MTEAAAYLTVSNSAAEYSALACGERSFTPDEAALAAAATSVRMWALAAAFTTRTQSDGEAEMEIERSQERTPQERTSG